MLRVITTVENNSGGTAVASAFSAHVRQNGVEVTGSPQAGAGAPGTLYTLTPGTYAVTADGVSGYAPTGSGACNAAGSVTLALGQTVTCTITVDDIAPTLRVITTVDNNSGGTAVASSFSAHVRQNGAEVAGSPQAGVGAPGRPYTLTPGTYAVTADGVPGYEPRGSGACSAAGSVTLALGEEVTCTITVDDIPATLRVVTNVLNNSGGQAERDDFDAHVKRNGAEVADSPQPGAAAPGTEYTLAAGTYVVSADGEPGYSAAFSTGCAGGTIVLALAQTATCTITLDDTAATLRVVTNVVNDSGGQAERDDFQAHVKRNGGEVTDSPQPGAAAPGTEYALAAGTYALSADGVPGYSASFSAACAGGTIDLALAQTATCTITLDDSAPTLRVITTVENNSGGSAVASDFSAHVRRGGTEVGSPQPGAGAPGTLHTLTPGTYAVTADGVAGYDPTGSGACDAAGSVTLALGEDMTCTITVDDIPATLRVVTNVVNNSGGSAVRGDFDVHVKRNGGEAPNSPQPGAGIPGTPYTLAAGSYDLSADGEPGYSASFSAPCAGGTIALALADTATCTITLNDEPGTLSVVTKVVNDDGGTAGADAFDVSVRLAGVDVSTSPQPGSESGTPYVLPPAAYTVVADDVPGYTFSLTGDCAPDGSITLPLQQARNCTVTANDVAPTLRVVTQVVNDHGGATAPSGFTVHVKRAGTDVSGSPQPGSDTGTAYTLTAGTHVVSADAVSGYGSAISGDCAGDGSITLGIGDKRTCTVTANDEPPPVRAQASQQLPPPEPGESVNALPKSGTVKVKVPGSAAYVDLDEAQQLPVGTIVDATKGHVTLVAAADDSGGTATAEFWAGIFKLGQTKGKAPTTILTLVEKLSCPKAGKAIAAAKKKKRRLWGDGSGKFRTKGKHSAATVVGTKWLVEDSCKSTLTRVVRGRVSVRDFAKKKTVIVRAGKKYVARARR